MTKRKRLLVGCFLFALLFFKVLADLYAFRQEQTRASSPRWTAELREGKKIINSVDAEGPAVSVLRVGDEIVAIDGAFSQSSPKVDVNRWLA